MNDAFPCPLSSKRWVTQRPRSMRPLPPAQQHPITPARPLWWFQSVSSLGTQRPTLQAHFANPDRTPTAARAWGHAAHRHRGSTGELTRSPEPATQRNLNKIPTCFQKQTHIPTVHPPVLSERFQEFPLCPEQIHKYLPCLVACK